MNARKTKPRHAAIDRPEVWRLLFDLGLDDLAPHALAAGTNGEAWWASLRSEHAIARAALALGSVTAPEVVARAVLVAAETDPAAKSLSLDLPPAKLAELRDTLDRAETFASTRWAARAALELALGRTSAALFAALEALRLVARDAPENWSPRPAALTRWVAPSEQLELVPDAPFHGWVSVRRIDGEDGVPDPATVRALVSDAGLELGGADGPLGFTGSTLCRDGQLFVVHRPRLSGAAWDPIVEHWIEVRASAETGIAWRIGGPAPIDSERSSYHAAIENAVTDAVERSNDARLVRTWRAFVRGWPSGSPAFAVQPSDGGWRRIVPGGEGLASFAAHWRAVL